MGFSSVVGEQRQKEAKARNSFLALSLIGSLALHTGFLLFGINNLWNRVPEIEEEPVEVVIVDPPPAPEPEKPPEKPQTQPKQSGGSSAASSPPARQTPARSQPSSRSQATTKPAPTQPKVAPSPPPKPVAKQPPDESRQELVEELQKPPVQPPKPTPSPEVAASPKPVAPPPPVASPRPAPPAQTPEQDIARLREQLARESSATNSPASTQETGQASSSSNQGQTSSSQPGTSSGTARQGTPQGQGSGTARQGTPQGQGRGEGDPEGSDSGSVACRSNCKPKYPERARKRGQEGKVAVRVVADANGKVTSAEIARSSGNSALDQAALKQARQAKISAPAGKPVTMNFNFSLD